MKVLVIGSGGREHALAWKIAKSRRASKVFAAPGNAGISEVAECIQISSNNINELAEFAAKEKVDLTVIGPESPLIEGIVDEFERRGLPIFGPTKRASILEGSKAFTKKFATKYNIPTANYAIFTEGSKAKSYIKDKEYPLVVKADGLAAGKGVIVCRNRADAEAAIDACLRKNEFGEAGHTIVIEDFLQGEEVSFIAISDGEHILPLASSQDHKAVYDGDQGPNTGGMGAYSPAPIVTKEMSDEICQKILLPTVQGMEKEGRPFRGFLYAGLMIAGGRPYLLEYNVRLGDPEAQPLMRRLASDIIPLFEAALEGTLPEVFLEWSPMASVCVVMSSRGYPGNYEKGMVIQGLSAVAMMEDIVVFHAGTKKDNSQWLTNGGRVLSVTAVGVTIPAAVEKAYQAIQKIGWEGAHYRKDIGWRALKCELVPGT